MSAPGFWFGDIGQNFIDEFLSSPVLQWRRQNFGSGGVPTFRKKYTHQRLLKNFENKFAQKFKILIKIFKNKI